MRVVALTHDFQVFVTRLTTGFSEVFVSLRHSRTDSALFALSLGMAITFFLDDFFDLSSATTHDLARSLEQPE